MGLTGARPDYGYAGGDHGDHGGDHHGDHCGDHHGGDHGAAENDVGIELTTPGQSEKKCELTRSLTATSPECFLEPECEQKCVQDSKQVGERERRIFGEKNVLEKTYMELVPFFSRFSEQAVS